MKTSSRFNVEGQCGAQSPGVARFPGTTKENRLWAIVDELDRDSKSIRYGFVSVTLKIHDGRVVDVTHSITKSNRKRVEAGNETGL